MERRNVFYEPLLDSTNTRLKSLAAEGAEHGSVLYADVQTAGRGRQGRLFESPEEGLYLSILWRPACEPQETLSITPMLAHCVYRAVKEVAGLELWIKWPNDLIINGKKVCGILTELSTSSDTLSIVAGIGLNVNTPKEAFSAALRDVAGSLYTESGKLWDISKLRSELIKQLDLAYEAWEKDKKFFLEDYRASCINVGREVLILRNGTSSPAFALAVNEDFSLKVRYADAREENISYGEVSIRDIDRYCQSD